jgi:hypothetical protein
MNLIERLFIPDYSFFFMISALVISTSAMVFDNGWLWLILVPVFIFENWVQYTIFGEDEDEL